MVRCLGRRGSKRVALPFAFRFCCAASALVMADVVERTYSLVAVREESGRGTSGQSAFWIVFGRSRSSVQM